MQSNLPSLEDYLPDWSRYRIVVIDRSGRWAAAIQAEHEEQRMSAEPAVEFVACENFRDALDYLSLRNTVAFIVFVEGLEREALGFVRQVQESMVDLPQLIVMPSELDSLIPVFMEAGIQSVMLDVMNDVPVAQWCRRLLRQLR